MTVIEFKEKLEAVPKFILQPPFDPIEYRFKDGHLYKDGKPYTKYTLLEGRQPNYFNMNLSDVFKDGEQIFLYEYDNIIINIDGDDEFPVFVNCSTANIHKRKFIILQAKN